MLNTVIMAENMRMASTHFAYDNLIGGNECQDVMQYALSHANISLISSRLDVISTNTTSLCY